MSEHIQSSNRTAQGRMPGDTLLSVRELRVEFPIRRRPKVVAVDGISFDVPKGTVVGIVGESGSGKTMTANAILRLLPQPGEITGGEVVFQGQNLLSLDPEAMRQVRGKRISMIFQNPMTALNPAFTIGRQMSDMLMFHEGMSKDAARDRSLQLLSQVGIPTVERQFESYPHQMSGGMRQRVIIAMALSCSPQLLIADEPTTALDVTIQAQILDLMEQLTDDSNRSIVLITHDFGVIARLCDDVVVMFRGRIVEQGPVERILRAPEHPYTRALLDAIPRPGQKGKRLATVDDPLIRQVIADELEA